jgi:hypothetical protein
MAHELLYMKCFRIDESGNTGHDLLNQVSPPKVIGIAIEDAEAAQLIREYFSKLQASEMKGRVFIERSCNHLRLFGR